MRSGVAGVIVAICVLSVLWYDEADQLDRGISVYLCVYIGENRGLKLWQMNVSATAACTPKQLRFSGIVGFILFANLALLNLLTAIMVEAVVDILRLDSPADSMLWLCHDNSGWVSAHQKGRDDQHSHLFEPLWEWYAWIVKPRPKKRNLIAAEVDFKQSAWHFWTPDIFQYFSILFTCFCPTDACRQPGSELLTRETASRVKKLKELFHKMDAQRVGTSSFNGQDMLRPAYWNEGSDWVGPVFCALILPWHWHVVLWHAASMCFHFAPLVRKLLVPKDEHGSKRVSCHEFQDNVDQHVKDELGKLQFPGSSIMLLLCFTRGSPLTA